MAYKQGVQLISGKTGQKVKVWNEQSYKNYLSWGFSEKSAPAPAPTPKPPASKPTPRPAPTPAPRPSAPARDTSHKTVYKGGKSTIIQAWQMSDYLGRGYTSSYVAPKPAPTTVPTDPIAPMPTPVEPQAITPEQLTPVELPEIEQPDQSIRDIFGPEWKPAPVFEQLGLTEQGIYGAVRIKGMDDVYTIGEGGRKETAESYLERFGTAEQTGIVGEISVEEAKKLGITLETDTLVSDISGVLPNSLTAEMTPEQKAQVGTDILAAAEIKYGIEGLKEEKDTATINLINAISGMWEKFEEAKEGKEADLALEEKNKAISDAQTAYTDVKSAYDKTMEGIKNEPIPMNLIYGNQARVRSQQALDLAPLATAIQIAQGNWDRAKEILDDFSDDWKQAQEWNLQAAQMKINMLGENLTEAQEKSRFEAQNKLDWFREDYNRTLTTQDEVKRLSLMYPEANVSIADDWNTAYKKVTPFIKNEKDFEDKMRNIEMAIAQKRLTDTGGGGTTAESDVGTYALALKNGEVSLSGIPIAIRAEVKRLADDVVKVQGQWIYKPTGENLGGAVTEEAEGLSDEEFYQQTKEILDGYKDKGFSKEEIKNSFGKDFTMDHQVILDEVFGAERTFWQWLIPGGK